MSTTGASVPPHLRGIGRENDLHIKPHATLYSRTHSQSAYQGLCPPPRYPPEGVMNPHRHVEANTVPDTPSEHASCCAPAEATLHLDTAGSDGDPHVWARHDLTTQLPQTCRKRPSHNDHHSCMSYIQENRQKPRHGGNPLSSHCLGGGPIVQPPPSTSEMRPSSSSYTHSTAPPAPAWARTPL